MGPLSFSKIGLTRIWVNYSVNSYVDMWKKIKDVAKDYYLREINGVLHY
jgi:hypothetical protein